MNKLSPDFEWRCWVIFGGSSNIRMGSYSEELYQISSNVVFAGTRFRTMRAREEKQSAKWLSLQTRVFVEDAEKAFQDLQGWQELQRIRSQTKWFVIKDNEAGWLQLGQLMDSVGWSNRASWIRGYWSGTCRSAICADRIWRYICRTSKITPSENPWSQDCA